MKKGQTHKKNKYTSVILIPSSTKKVKTMKITALYGKLAALLMLLAVTIACLVFLTGYAINENKKLQASRTVLESLIADQKDLLTEKADQIAALQEFEADTQKDIQSFIEQYTKITEKYISDRLESSKTNRSGVRDDSAFIDDINGLKIILDNLSKSNTGDRFSPELAETEEKLRKYIDAMPTLWPISGKISSGYGGRRDPFNKAKAFHEGLDIAADYGQVIKAAGGGKVEFAGWDDLYGRTVILDHGYGIKTLYGHTSKLAVKSGQTVKKGDIVAYVGSSGRSTGSHLHFEVWLSGAPVDPLKYLESN